MASFPSSPPNQNPSEFRVNQLSQRLQLCLGLARIKLEKGHLAIPYPTGRESNSLRQGDFAPFSPDSLHPECETPCPSTSRGCRKQFWYEPTQCRHLDVSGILRGRPGLGEPVGLQRTPSLPEKKNNEDEPKSFSDHGLKNGNDWNRCPSPPNEQISHIENGQRSKLTSTFVD
ncbi:hypothetical protein BDV59DRAFT_188885 [Aspergillus ambiguus]|uniref:uncharacterized protein n=1 Tax=Aspergillus ambiguus TaxID=176160 RepID=UPI003CCCC326